MKQINKIDDKIKNEVESIVFDDRTQNFFSKLLNKEFFNNFSFYKLKTLYFAVEDLYFSLKKEFEKANINQYMIETLDIEELRKLYRKKKLNKVFPNLNFERLKELYENPPEKLKSPAYKNNIIYDKIVARKYIISIIQMVFNNMDLLVVFTGREGTGKTTASTQDAYLVFYILQEIGLIDYEFNLKNCMYHNLKSIIDGFNKYISSPFRIFILDEGNELNRKEWSNPLVQLFFQKLRRERSSLRIVFINLPQLGELLPSITLSRVNFVFQLNMKADLKSKLAQKGKTYFYILPRFNKIYSYLNKKELTQYEVLNEFGVLLEDKKKYFQPIPKKLAVHKFERNGVWAFNEAEYEKRKKQANAEFSTSFVTLTRAEIYFLNKFMNLKKMEVKPNTKEYFILTNLKNKKLKPMVKNDKSLGEDLENEMD